VTPRLFLRAAAKADLREAFEWYEARTTGLGFEFLRAARAALALIERNERVVVIACAHGRQHPRRWSSRR
jgi:plasmid stabilization system protein ParE